MKKVRTIKEKSAVFFAKMELKLKENNDDTLQISKLFREWQETLQGPTAKFEAQIFAVKSSVQQAESERETEFGLMKEIVKTLVHALEDKTTTDLLTGNQTFSSNFGYTAKSKNQELGALNSPIGKLNSLHGRKSSQPPPSSKFDGQRLPAIAPQDPVGSDLTSGAYDI